MASLIDFMPLGADASRIDVTRIVCGKRGKVPMTMLSVLLNR